MKICLLTSTYHPLTGGAESYARMVAEGMHRLGHEVHVVTDGHRVDAPAFEAIGGVHVHRLRHYLSSLQDPTKVHWEQMYFGLLSELQDLLSDKDIEIIHANSLETALLGSMAASALGVPLVCTVHQEEPEKDAFGTGKCRFLFQQAPVDLFFSASRFYYEKALENGVDQDRATLIYHGIDLKMFGPREETPIRAEFGIGRDEWLIVSAARLIERKGLHELIYALRQVKDQVPNMRAILAGSCNDAARGYADLLYQTIKELGLEDSVQIVETLSFKNMPDLYAAADLVVQASRAEGLGLAVLEALASSKPVVATDIQGHREILTDEINSLLVPACEVEPLAQAIVKMLGDDALRQKCARVGRELMEVKFNQENMLQEIEAAYRRVIQAKAKHDR